MDLFDHAKKTVHIYTVSEIAQNVKHLLEDTFGVLWLEGEISNYGAHPSGHLYFSLKDQSAVLSAVMFSWANKNVKFKLENGLKVICFGKISAYGPQSKYQIIVEKIEPKGIGSRQLAFEQLTKKLQKEGLFATEHKRQIPYLPAKIGVVTSLSGAALKDILKVLDRRFAAIQVIINPAQVQGEVAKDDIARAISDLNRFNRELPLKERIEVMIVGRGGGSTEDLWAFNEEAVARAIYNSKIPVISAVGHERDSSIADLVADVRAATPSVAAELVIPEKNDLKDRLQELQERLRGSFAGIVMESEQAIDDSLRRLDTAIAHSAERSSQAFEGLCGKLALLNPSALLTQYQGKLENAVRQIYVRMQMLFRLRKSAFITLIEKLESLNPLAILSRGYSITFALPGTGVVKDSSRLKAGDMIKSRVQKGEIISQVTEVRRNGRDKV
ncbi:MAG: exodeoxyribonuclease VII large subunit [Candidatus Omnitrophota bacterium]|nr:MAG: exodeoxyribonuclease VII large subunit [Candidatus Omnitrophota bacterium]